METGNPSRDRASLSLIVRYQATLDVITIVGLFYCGGANLERPLFANAVCHYVRNSWSRGKVTDCRMAWADS